MWILCATWYANIYWNRHLQIYRQWSQDYCHTYCMSLKKIQNLFICLFERQSGGEKERERFSIIPQTSLSRRVEGRNSILVSPVGVRSLRTWPVFPGAWTGSWIRRRDVGHLNWHSHFELALWRRMLASQVVPSCAVPICVLLCVIFIVSSVEVFVFHVPFSL